MLMAGGMALAFTLSRIPQALAKVWRRILGKPPEASDDATADTADTTK
jgi:hypothetical protein